MPNQIFGHTLARIAICTAALALTALDARAADELLGYPDLSGQWGRDVLFLEPPPSGPGPVVRAERKADGTTVAQDPCCRSGTTQWLGDHTSSVLKPEAAEAIKKFGDLSLSGAVTPDLHNTCWPSPHPLFWGRISRCRFYS